MKKICFLFILNIFLLYSEEIKYKNFLINLSYDKEILVKKNNEKRLEVFTICGNEGSNLFFSIEISLIREKIFEIYSSSNFYFEFYYDEKSNNIIIRNLLGNFKIKVLNSYFNIIIKIENNTIINSISHYNIISYPENLLYISLNEGKLQFLNEKKSIIIIAGESLTLMENKIYISQFNDYNTINNIFINKIYLTTDKVLVSKNKKYYFNKIKEAYINSIIYKKEFIEKINK